MKKYVCGFLVMMVSYTTQASTVIDFLMECNVSTENIDDRVMFTGVRSDHFDNGAQHFVLWNNYGAVDVNPDGSINENPDRFGGIGAVFARMSSSEDAIDYDFYVDGDDYVYYADYDDGSEVRIVFEYAITDENGHNYDMYIDGRGLQFDYLITNYNNTLAESEHYNVGDSIACTEREDLI